MKDKKYKFYKYENNPEGSDYCFCQRPCDSNMSLHCFLDNGEILGFMSESLVSAYDNIKEITMSDFMFEFVKPLIKENYIMRTQQQEFIEWLEKEIEAIENKLNRYNELAKQGKETDFEYYKSIIDERKLDIYIRTLKKYKNIIGGENE